MKIHHGVAVFTAIIVGCAGELTVVHVFVAVDAIRVFHLVNRVLASGQVTFIAFHFRVLAVEGVARRSVFLDTKQRRFPTLHRVALRALALLGPRLKLAAMCVFVAVHAVRKRKLFLEVAVDVAGGTADRGVFSEQRILRLRMVKIESLQQFLPACGGVAFFATLLERTFVRIDMAIDASLKLHVFVTCRPAGFVRLVALLAGNLDVQSSQGVAGLRVIELLCCFPIREVVALQAIIPQLPLVYVFVTRHTILRQSEKRLGKIFHLDEGALIGNHVAGHVALLAGNVGMLAFQLVARLQVIELLLRWLPVDQAEVFSVVLQMAADAIPAVRILHSQAGVVAVIRSKTLGNLFVAIKALEGWRAGPELMATRALSGST